MNGFQCNTSKLCSGSVRNISFFKLIIYSSLRSNLPHFSSPIPLPHTCLSASWGSSSCFVLASWSVSPNTGLTFLSTILDLVATHFHILSTDPWNPLPSVNLHPRLKPFCMFSVVSAKNCRENRRAVLTSLMASS